MMKQAVCVVIENNEGQHLAVSRRNDITQWGFPGGKVDFRESNIDAAIRELQEEVGIYLYRRELTPIYSGVCLGKDGCDFWVTTYLFDAASIYDDAGVFKCEQGIEARWSDASTLTNPDHCPFASYNKEVFMQLKTLESYD